MQGTQYRDHRTEPGKTGQVMKHLIDGMTTRQIRMLSERRDRTPVELVKYLSGLRERIELCQELGFVCPRCKAAEGERCRTPRDRSHAPRVDVFNNFWNAIQGELSWTRSNFEMFGMCQCCWLWDGAHTASCPADFPTVTMEDQS
jgi:hypothetical protein